MSGNIQQMSTALETVCDHHQLCGRVLSSRSFALGRDQVVANGIYGFHWQTPAGMQRAEARFTYVWVRQQDGSWLISAHHSSAVPQ